MIAGPDRAGDACVTGTLDIQPLTPDRWADLETLFGPRASYPVLQRSPVLKPVDEQPVWSITCLLVARPWRKRGLSVELIRRAVRHAALHGATLVEGYPVDPHKKDMAGINAFTGIPSTFRKAGFKEVLRRSATRPIMRYRVASQHAKHARSQR
jgi:GNAT superfamily N-acetyltransferase